MNELNIYLFRMINDIGKQQTYLNPTLVFIAEYMVFFLAIAIIIFWFTRIHKNRMMVICGTITFVLAELIGKLVGKVHSNNQPFAELPNVNKLIEKAVNNSFPSDHTILFFSFCVTFWLFSKKLGYLWVVLAFLVGISRIWVGVHYPADVIVGAIISIVAALIVYKGVLQANFIMKLLGIYEKGEQYILPTKTKSKEY